MLFKFQIKKKNFFSNFQIRRQYNQERVELYDFYKKWYRVQEIQQETVSLDEETRIMKILRFRFDVIIWFRLRRNILSNVTNRYISDCSYDEDKDPLCPVFQLGYILARAETNETERFLMLLKGGVIQVEVIWNCDFDLYNRNCLPKYSFRRFDLPFHQTKTASGFNFRFADKFMTDGVERRVLYKAYGKKKKKRKKG